MNQTICRFLSGRFGAGYEIRVLMRQTAGAFGVDPPKTAGLSASDLLRTYAGFTAHAALHAVQSGQDLKNLQYKLYCMAYHLGSRVRRWLRPQDEQECMAILSMLYRNIGITIHEVRPGEICVSKCYFSSFYTPNVCMVISAVDKGMFAGVCHGGTLKFSERITEGKDACRATFR